MSYLIAAYIICFALLAIYLVILGGRVAGLLASGQSATDQGVSQ